ncbi:hypothetical protein Droror1_Dr00026727, partial [Drosera rotundifolia]
MSIKGGAGVCPVEPGSQRGTTPRFLDDLVVGGGNAGGMDGGEEEGREGEVVA